MDLAGLFKRLAYRYLAPQAYLRERYEAFRNLLEQDQRAHECIAELEQIHQGDAPEDNAAAAHG